MRNPPLFWADVEREEEEEQRRCDACELSLWFGRCWRMAAWRCFRGWVCGGEGSGGLVELFGGVVGGGVLVVEWCLVQNNDSKRKTAI